MKKINTIVFVAMLSLLTIPNTASADGFFSWLFDFSRTKGVEPVSNENYQEECGACHFAYQPGLLTGDAWANLMQVDKLEDHFGENAELDDEEVRTELLAYLKEQAAENSYYKRSRQITHSLNGEEIPERITDVRYIRRQHHEIPESLITDNEDVRSLSYCDTCHTKAALGIYDDDTVNIPNHGVWDD
ncbi:MAG: diheme cytochrome c [Pseudomonadales bacterium]|nr:diheme cytochrome c [Pseudomonadales bacterium]